MCGNKMIGTVFFLAIAAPLVAAQYPATQQSYPTTTPSYPPVYPATYQPPSYPEPSHETKAPISYEPSYTTTSYEPSHTPTGNEPSHTPTDYEQSHTPTDYEPSQTPTGYEPSYTTTSYEPSHTPTDYEARHTPTGYESSYTTASYEPSYTTTGYEPSHTPTGYEPSHTTTGYEPSHTPTGYEPSHTTTGYEPSTTPTSYEPSHNPTDYEQSHTPTDYEPTYDNQGSYSNEYPQGPYHQPVNAPIDVFSQYPSAPIRNIRAEVADAGAQITGLLRTDRIYNTNLDIIESKVNQTTRFREEFENKIYQQLVASIAAQDKQIEQYRAQLGDLSNLTGQVKELNEEVIALIGELLNTRARQSATWGITNKLYEVGLAEDLAIVAVEDQVDGNDDLLDIINATRTSNLARNAENVADLQNVVEVINEEQAEIYTVTLTAQNKSVHIQYETEFVTAPQLVYSIIGIDIVDINEQSSGSAKGNNTNSGYRKGGNNNPGYEKGDNNNPGYGKGGNNNPGYDQGGNHNETIYPRVHAQGDAKGVTVSFTDRSVGWRTEYVRVRIAAFITNNEKIRRNYY